jgi:hypothetical protein
MPLLVSCARTVIRYAALVDNSTASHRHLASFLQTWNSAFVLVLSRSAVAALTITDDVNYHCCLLRPWVLAGKSGHTGYFYYLAALQPRLPLPLMQQQQMLLRTSCNEASIGRMSPLSTSIMHA